MHLASMYAYPVTGWTFFVECFAVVRIFSPLGFLLFHMELMVPLSFSA